ncbi:puromycin resistance protein pur8 [Aspergillus heteromorphus CBS 117.55]|uniref:Puromycin resistance protein pur8 n=1 Tax=Aspergillus heteromorphus CBS 117.55 TaxID=1448321 RepID=A0A317WVJ2_9EURO|nr:puromycin resistance protein pur8 [Aspergillus heteromorphus CBS 117.55]PWY90095.1 puromycin resistance protein pur8 [Aspergillus heteromorphus CBS 117.55]
MASTSSRSKDPSSFAVEQRASFQGQRTGTETIVLETHHSFEEQDEPPIILRLSGEDNGSSEPPIRAVSTAKGVTVIVTLAGVSFLNTMGSGILIAALPRIAQDIGIPDGLILWPAAVYALAAGCLLLIFGAVADIIGAKLLWVTGSFLYVVLTLAIGLSRTGLQMILFRTFLGIAISMCLPTAVGLITHTFPRGPWRNTAFAMNGMGQPLGYALGLVLGGIFTDTVGWRWAYYMMAIINFGLSMASIWSLPSIPTVSSKSRKRRLIEEVDWLGAVLISVGLGLLMYVLAMTTSSYRNIGEAQNIVLLVLSISLLVAFPFWIHHQTKHSRPALIPNKLWRNPSFTSICISVFFCWASLNSLEYFATLYFQNIQGLSALQSSLRFLPHVIMGVSVNIITAILIARVRIQILATVSALITLIAPILMATVRIDESFWLAPFWALFLSPMNPDVLFTVSNLVISDAFPPDIQSLAGGVFNEVAQFGNSVGLAVTAAIAASITEHANASTSTSTSPSAGLDERQALMKGYRGAFWTVFASAATVLVVVFVGLRNGGMVGVKRD